MQLSFSAIFKFILSLLMLGLLVFGGGSILHSFFPEISETYFSVFLFFALAGVQYVRNPVTFRNPKAKRKYYTETTRKEALVIYIIMMTMIGYLCFTHS